MTDNNKFDMWCVVELFGHNQIAGKVTEQTIGGATFVRVDVPKTTKRDGFTRFYGPGAIYSMTPVDEKIALLMAERLEVEAVSEWKLSQAMRDLLPATALGGDDNDHDYGTDNYDDEEDESDVPFFGDTPDVKDEPESESEKKTTTSAYFKRIDSDREKRLAAKRAAAQWARDLLKGEFVVFDTETTGFESDDEIVQIGIVNQAGEVVLERLIKPTKPVPNSEYHGITDEMLINAPGFAEVHGQIKIVLDGKKRVAHNLEYDSRMINQVCRQHQLPEFLWADGDCAMEMYAQFNGEWNDYHGNYRWKKLREALAAFGLKHEDFGTKEHDACTDARATLAVIKKMAEFEAEKSAATEELL
jgi:DNA polymerase III epsilon subunit-like protein